MTLHSAFLYHCWLYYLTSSLKRGEKHEISLKVQNDKNQALKDFSKQWWTKICTISSTCETQFLNEKRGGKDIIMEKYKAHTHLKIKVTFSLTAWKKTAQNSLLLWFRWFLRIARSMKYDPKSHKTSSCASANTIIILHQMLLIYSEANKENTAEHPL